MSHAVYTVNPTRHTLNLTGSVSIHLHYAIVHSNGHQSKRRGSEGGTTANKKRRVVLTPEEEEARRLKEEIELLESQLKSLDEVAERQTKKKRTEPRTAPPPPPTDVDFWDEEDYDDEVDVGGYAPGSRVASSRARRTPRPSNKYDTQFDTKV